MVFGFIQRESFQFKEHHVTYFNQVRTTYKRYEELYFQPFAVALLCASNLVKVLSVNNTGTIPEGTGTIGKGLFILKAKSFKVYPYVQYVRTRTY